MHVHCPCGQTFLLLCVFAVKRKCSFCVKSEWYAAATSGRRRSNDRCQAGTLNLLELFGCFAAWRFLFRQVERQARAGGYAGRGYSNALWASQPHRYTHIKSDPVTSHQHRSIRFDSIRSDSIRIRGSTSARHTIHHRPPPPPSRPHRTTPRHAIADHPSIHATVVTSPPKWTTMLRCFILPHPKPSLSSLSFACA